MDRSSDDFRGSICTQPRRMGQPSRCICVCRSDHGRRDRLCPLVPPGTRRRGRMIFTAAFAAGLACLEYFIYFRSNPHFFQGDSIYYFYLRHRTLKDFLLGFFSLDPAGWYRPLTARTVQSLLYPWFGLNPPAYRVVHLLLFMSTIFAIYKLAVVVTRRRLAACVATFFFAVHTVNAWATYDVLFTPELVVTFFYVCATAAYLRYRQSEDARFFLLSI